jgi:hypothetical protein
MAYKLAALSEEDIGKVLEDARGNDRLMMEISCAHRNQNLPKAWACTEDKSSYLLAIPTIMREDWERRPYCFLFEGLLRSFAFVKFFGPTAEFTDQRDVADIAYMSRLNQALREVFAIHKEYLSLDKDGGIAAKGDDAPPQFSI